jgi:hypothetical protein
MEQIMIRVEQCRKFADRCLEWADSAKHAEVRSVYMKMADEWARRAREPDAVRGDSIQLRPDLPPRGESRR